MSSWMVKLWAEEQDHSQREVLRICTLALIELVGCLWHQPDQD
jgi:hypothetical protein